MQRLPTSNAGQTYWIALDKFKTGGYDGNNGSTCDNITNFRSIRIIDTHSIDNNKIQ